MKLNELTQLQKVVTKGALANECKTSCVAALETHDAYCVDELTLNAKGGVIRVQVSFEPKTPTVENPSLMITFKAIMKWSCAEAIRTAINACRSQAAAEFASIDPTVLIPE